MSQLYTPTIVGFTGPFTTPLIQAGFYNTGATAEGDTWAMVTFRLGVFLTDIAAQFPNNVSNPLQITFPFIPNPTLRQLWFSEMTVCTGINMPQNCTKVGISVSSGTQVINLIGQGPGLYQTDILWNNIAQPPAAGTPPNLNDPTQLLILQGTIHTLM